MPLGDGRWGAVQLLGRDGHGVVVAALAHVGAARPTLDELATAPILRTTHHLWKGEPEVLGVRDEAVPSAWEPLGVAKAREHAPVRRFGSFASLPEQVLAQHAWDHELPRAAVAAFERAIANAQSVLVSVGGPARDLSLGRTRLAVRPGGDLEPPAEGPIRWAALDALPALLELQVARVDAALLAWLPTRPLLHRLHVDAASELDVSRAVVRVLAVVLEGPGPLRLSPHLRSLVVTARSPELTVEADDAGARLSLHLLTGGAPLPRTTGLAALGSLRVDGPRVIDVGAIADDFPDLRALTLGGGGAALARLDALGRLTRLERLFVADRHDLEPEHLLPGPALRSVEISGFRRSRRAALTRALAGVEHVALRGARADAVLDRDADCPFLDWSDDAAALGAGAVRAWRAAKKALAEDPRAAIEALVKSLNRLDEKHGLDTVRREQALEAVVALGRASSLGEDEAVAIFERLRRF